MCCQQVMMQGDRRARDDQYNLPTYGVDIRPETLGATLAESLPGIFRAAPQVIRHEQPLSSKLVLQL